MEAGPGHHHPIVTRRTRERPQLDLPLLGLPGIGPSRAAAYESAGLCTRRDLLYHLPVRYRLRPEAGPVAALEDGERGALVAEVVRSSVRRRGRHSTVSLKVKDDAGDEALVLLFNRAYLAKGLRGARVWAAGKAERGDEGPPRLLAADYERLPDGADGPAAACLPLYRLPAGVPPRVHRKTLATILEAGGPEDWREPGPVEPTLAEALRSVHLPTSVDEARRGRKRLVWDEAFAHSLAVGRRRAERVGLRAPALVVDDALHRQLLDALPHTPTNAQARVLHELRADLADGSRPMGRLLQGDVGSGKTLIAFYALLAAAACGRQGAIMAPTEVLADQHLRGLRQLLHDVHGDDAPRVASITGRGTAAERRDEREAVALGTASLVVGTHALQTKGLQFADLAVTVVDEQHRFGVRQRVRFRGKGEDTHLLVMTATPIPRTLSLTAYGELDVSLLDELPPGRSPRDTRYVTPSKQGAMWRALRAAVERGEQGYVVCPSIDSDEAESHSVAATRERVREELGDDVRVGSVHGRLPGDERDAVLDAFRAGEVDVLVATVLVEVGLDVPAATFVVVPDPSRFGLATLHQIRGRVGRGDKPGRCLLLGPLAAGKAKDRVDALVDTEDGFLLAEKDLELRGPGELLGTRQSGMPGFLVMDPVRDVDVLADARPRALEAARELAPAELEALRTRAFPATRVVAENLLAGG